MTKNYNSHGPKANPSHPSEQLSEADRQIAHHLSEHIQARVEILKLCLSGYDREGVFYIVDSKTRAKKFKLAKKCEKDRIDVVRLTHRGQKWKDLHNTAKQSPLHSTILSSNATSVGTISDEQTIIQKIQNADRPYVATAEFFSATAGGESTSKGKKKNRPTALEMENRNRTVAMTAGEIKVKYDRLPTVAEIKNKTRLTADQIYATAPYHEGKIAKVSAKITTELNNSLAESEQFGKNTIEQSRATKRSKSDQYELDAAIDQQKKDQSSNFAT